MTKCDGIHNEFQGAMFEMSLVQFVHVPTRGENILDLVFVTCLNNVVDCEIISPISTSDHRAILHRHLLYSNLKEVREESFDDLDFRRMDVGRANACLCSVNGRSIFATARTVDDYVAKFMAV